MLQQLIAKIRSAGKLKAPEDIAQLQQYLYQVILTMCPN